MATGGAWLDPGSRRGLVMDVGWMVAMAVFFAGTAILEPAGHTVDPTPAHVVGASVLGVVLGVGLVYLPVLTGRIQDVWADKRSRFAVLFVVVLAVQVLLQVAPTWTVLTSLVTAVVAVPTRIVAYRQATRD